MNEAETRAELIDPQLKACGWGVVDDSKILREYPITAGRIQTGGVRAKKLTADYVLLYKGIKLAVIEAKSDELGVWAKGLPRLNNMPRNYPCKPLMPPMVKKSTVSVWQPGKKVWLPII